MDHSRLVETVLHEIAAARAGIAANYVRLWRAGPASEHRAQDVGPSDHTAEDPPDSRGDDESAADVDE